MKAFSFLAIALLLVGVGVSQASVESIRHPIHLPSISEPTGEDMLDADATTLVETLSEGDLSYKLFYAVESDGDPRLIAVEKWDSSSVHLIAFRHRFMSGGEERWTDWLPATLRDGADVSWPEASSLSSPSRGFVRTAVNNPELLSTLEKVRQNADAEFRIFGDAPRGRPVPSPSPSPSVVPSPEPPRRAPAPAPAPVPPRPAPAPMPAPAPVPVPPRPAPAPSPSVSPSAPAPAPGSARYSWQQGEYSWSYDKTRWTPWAGYLWEYKNGWMWRGYRKPSVPGEVLTPSQNQVSTDPARIEAYYRVLPSQIRTTYHEWNSRWLSPLDKWGIWAWRRFGQNWWSAPQWEAINKFTNFEWGGYCNASSAMAMLYRRPTKSFVDQNITFDPRDIVALMQVATWKVDYLFFGRRYNSPRDDISDPSPRYVVELIDEYLGKHGTALVMDHEAGPAVGNVVLLSAKLKIQNTSDPLVRTAQLELVNMGNMDDTMAEKLEVAMVPPWTWGTDTKVFAFKVYLNADGSLRSTAWDDEKLHPDFFWFPTGNREYEPPHRKNPFVQLFHLHQLMKKSY